MAGVCRPRAAAALVKALKEETGLPVHFHTHDTSGIASASVLAAIDAGCDAVDGAFDAMSGLTSQPNLSAIAAALSGSERDPGERYSPDQFGTLLRLLQVFNPFYDANANNIVDARGVTGTNADIAFGGAGHDVLIGNTASDRLYDENGPSTTGWNADYVPWGGNTSTLTLAANTDGVAQFLLDLGLALGADPTRAETLPPAPQTTDYLIRNGEPFGELGMIDPADAALVALDDGRGATPPTPWPWTGGENPGLGTLPTITG